MSNDGLREQVAREIVASVRGRRWGDMTPLMIADALMPLIREAQARALTDAADRLSGATEGPQREGTARWPQVHREVYSLAIDEAQVALRDLAAAYTERTDR
ncbi:hypothetical protein [Pseudactinotalea sp. Z1732]|uniref:hypothetical protein n=1 Tax=Micrococcales TaxID=85006 RepID=UPI003C7DEE78